MPVSSEDASSTRSQFPDSPDRETFQGLGEKVWKGCETHHQAAGRRDEKEENEGGETSSTGDCCKTPSPGHEKGLRVSENDGFGLWRSGCAKVWWGGEGGRADGQPPLKKLRRQDKTLHSSWEAKNRMKEKESTAIMRVQQGNRSYSKLLTLDSSSRS